MSLSLVCRFYLNIKYFLIAIEVQRAIIRLSSNRLIYQAYNLQVFLFLGRLIPPNRSYVTGANPDFYPASCQLGRILQNYFRNFLCRFHNNINHKNRQTYGRFLERQQTRNDIRRRGVALQLFVLYFTTIMNSIIEEQKKKFHQVINCDVCQEQKATTINLGFKIKEYHTHYRLNLSKGKVISLKTKHCIKINMSNYK